MGSSYGLYGTMLPANTKDVPVVGELPPMPGRTAGDPGYDDQDADEAADYIDNSSFKDTVG